MVLKLYVLLGHHTKLTHTKLWGKMSVPDIKNLGLTIKWFCKALGISAARASSLEVLNCSGLPNELTRAANILQRPYKYVITISVTSHPLPKFDIFCCHIKSISIIVLPNFLLGVRAFASS